MTVTTTFAPTEFDTPPQDPVALFGQWFDRAKQNGVRDPGALSLATVGVHGRPSNRIVQIVRVTPTGLVFTSHAGSGKGRDLAVNPWASGVLYWRETSQQIVLGGPVSRMADSESDDLWASRPVGTHAMSVASHQSAPLRDERELRAKAERLAALGKPLPRPPEWCGYHMSIEQIEFWQGSPDRLHRRLRYGSTSAGWAAARLQP